MLNKFQKVEFDFIGTNPALYKGRDPKFLIKRAKDGSRQQFAAVFVFRVEVVNKGGESGMERRFRQGCRNPFDCGIKGRGQLARSTTGIVKPGPCAPAFYLR